MISCSTQHSRCSDVASIWLCPHMLWPGSSRLGRTFESILWKGVVAGVGDLISGRCGSTLCSGKNGAGNSGRKCFLCSKDMFPAQGACRTTGAACKYIYDRKSWGLVSRENRPPITMGMKEQRLWMAFSTLASLATNDASGKDAKKCVNTGYFLWCSWWGHCQHHLKYLLTPVVGSIFSTSRADLNALKIYCMGRFRISR